LVPSNPQGYGARVTRSWHKNCGSGTAVKKEYNHGEGWAALQKTNSVSVAIIRVVEKGGCDTRENKNPTQTGEGEGGGYPEKKLKKGK